MHRIQICVCIALAAPGADAGQAEGVLTVQDPELALVSVVPVRHPVQADAALHFRGCQDSGKAVLTRGACFRVCLSILLVVRVQGMLFTDLQGTELVRKGFTHRGRPGKEFCSNLLSPGAIAHCNV